MVVIWTWNVATFKTLLKVKRNVKYDTDRDFGRHLAGLTNRPRFHRGTGLFLTKKSLK